MLNGSLVSRDLLVGLSHLVEYRVKKASFDSENIVRMQMGILEKLRRGSRTSKVSDELVEIEYKGEVKVQGPILMQPVPLEANDDYSAACDLHLIATDTLDVVLLASQTGKVDVLLCVEPMEPLYSEKVPLMANSR